MSEDLEGERLGLNTALTSDVVDCTSDQDFLLVTLECLCFFSLLLPLLLAFAVTDVWLFTTVALLLDEDRCLLNELMDGRLVARVGRLPLRGVG